MEEADKYVVGGGVRQLGDSPVLQGCDTGGPYVRFGFLGTVRCNDTFGVGHPRGVSKLDHWEAVPESGRWDLRETIGGGGHTGGRYKVGGISWCTSSLVAGRQW